MKFIYKVAVLAFLVFNKAFLLAQSHDTIDSKTSVALSKEVINPTALFWQMQLEDKFVSKFQNIDGIGNRFRLRMIIPLKRGLLINKPVLIRFIGFLNSIPVHGTGLSNLTYNQFWVLLDKKWGNFGLGYNFQIPTSRTTYFGSPQYNIGPAASITMKNLGHWEMYYIIQNFFSITNNDQYGFHATMNFQPNIFYTWNNGIYTGIEPEWLLDFRTGAVSIPMNLRLGYIFQSKKYKFNIYAEPEWRTYRSKKFTSDIDDFGVKFGFRIFFRE